MPCSPGLASASCFAVKVWCGQAFGARFAACVKGYNVIGVDEARGICKSSGYDDLASILTATEQDIVAAMTAALPEDGLWIGLDDIEEEGAFRWSDGNKLEYTNWMPGNPGDTLGGEDCVEFYYPDGTWNDINCSWKVDGFICAHRPSGG